AEDGDTRALKGLAYMRLDANEKRFNPEEAASMLTRAADAGDPEAMFELGKLYEQGIGVKQDVKRAVELFRKAADLDFADAINDLGFLHFQGGEGVVRDQKRALEFFERAARLRHPEAMFNYAALIDDGVVPGKTPEDSASFLYEALRSGNEDVLQQLSDNPKMFKEQTRSALQRKLAAQDFYDGSIDGDFGPQTKRSLRKAYGLSE
ncbi:MAG: sel1 repeat family protein, partial [Nitratireductor sp.]|nr:sel1 repeat family protein [Nitratireductor sp.]